MKIGTLMIEMAANVARLERDMRRATNTVDGAMNKIRRAASLAVKALGALGAGIGIAQFAQMVRQTSAMADEIDRFSRLANTTTAEFQKISIAAQRFGVSQEKVADILKDVQDKVGDFLQTGAGPMVDFFEQIAPKVGVTAEQFRKLSGREALQLYVSSIEKANLSQSDMVFYMEAIASDSTLLLPLLKNNGKAYAEIASEAEKLGQVLSDETIQANRELAQELMKLDAAFQGLKNQALAPIIETLRNMAAALTEMIANGAIQKGIENLVMVFKALAVVLVSRVVGALAATAAGMIKTATAMTALELALVAGAVKMKAFAVAANVAKGALAFIGGPVGVAVTAAAAIYHFAVKNDEATQSVEGFRKAQGLSNQTIKEFDLFDANTQLNEYQIELAKAQVEVIKLTRAQQELNASSADPEAYHFLGGQNSTAMKEAQIRSQALKDSISDLEAHIESLEAAEESSAQTRTEFNNSLNDSGKSVEDLEDKYRDLIRAYTDETDMLSMTRAERELFIFQNKLIADGVGALTIQYKHLTDAKRAAIQQRIAKEDELEAIDKQVEALKEFKQEAEDINNQIGQSLTDALMNGGRNAKDMLISLFRTLVLRPILQPIITGVTGAFGLGSAGASLAGTTMEGVAGAGTDWMSLGSILKTGYDVVAGGFASVGAAASSATKTLLGFEAAVASGAAAPGAQAAAAAQINSISASAATVGAAATVLAGVAAGVTAGTFISGDYKVFGDQMVSTGVGTAAGAIAGAIIGGGPIGAAIGAAIGGAIGGGINRAFGYGPETTESAGIQGDLTTDGALVRQYAVLKKKGGWFRGDKNRAEYADLEQGALDSLSSMSIQVASSVALMADSLGLEVEKIKDVKRGFILETMGKTEEEITALIGEQMGYFADQLAETIEPAIWNFKRGGESASEILTRLSTNLTTVNSQFNMLGFTLYDSSLKGADAAQKFVDAFGGIEQMSQATNFYFENFYSAQEKIDYQTKQLSGAFEMLGLVLPDTNDQFRAMVESAEAAGNDSLLAALLKIAPAFKGLTNAVSQAAQQIEQERTQLQSKIYQLTENQNALRQREIDGLDESNRALQMHIYAIEDAAAAQQKADQEVANARTALQAAISAELTNIQTKIDEDLKAALGRLSVAFELLTDDINAQISELQDAQSEAREVVQNLSSIFNYIQSAVSDINGGSSMSAAAGVAFINDALNSAKSGEMPEIDDLRDAVTAAKGGLSSDNFATARDQLLAEVKLINTLSELQGYVEAAEDEAKGTVESNDKQIELLQQRLEQARLHYNDQTAETRKYYDDQLTSQRQQLDALLGVNSGVISVSSAVQALATAIQNQKISDDNLDSAKDSAQVAATLGDTASVKKPTLTDREKAIAGYYDTYLGRSAAGYEIEYWDDGGMTLSKIVDSIKNSPEGVSYQIEQAYQDILGRSSDAGGLAYWTQKMLDGEIDINGVRAHFSTVDKNAQGGYYGGGLSLVGEQGPELVNFARPSMIYTANETRDILSKGGSDNEDVKTELKHIREENQANQQAIVSLQYRMFKIFQRWDGEGLPDERTVSV